MGIVDLGPVLVASLGGVAFLLLNTHTWLSSKLRVVKRGPKNSGLAIKFSILTNLILGL